MFAAVFLGFARSFFLRPFFPEVSAPRKRHLLRARRAFTAWCLLMVAQPLLVAGDRTDLHRRIGTVAASWRP